MSYEVRMWSRGWYRILQVLVGSLLLFLPACNLVGGKTTTLSLQTTPTSIAAGSQMVFTATISHNNGQFLGANWTLATNGVACPSACGTLSNPTNNGSQGNGDTATIAYTAPNSPPVPNSITITATSVENPNSAESDTFIISGAVLAVQTTSVPQGTVGVDYNSALQAVGGTPPYSWSYSPGASGYPPGLNFDAAGNLTGTPTAEGTFPFSAQVYDSAGGTASANLSFLISTTQAALSTISVAPANLTMYSTSNQPFEAVGQYADGSTQDVTGGVTWQSSNSAVATVSATGVVSALGPGNTTVSANFGSVQASTTVAVSAATTGFTAVNDLTDSRLALYQGGGGNFLTILGTRDSSGNATSIYGMRATAPDQSWQEFLFDSQGRPYIFNTSDGSQFTVDWVSSTNPVLTGVSSDFTTSASVPLTLAAPASATKRTQTPFVARRSTSLAPSSTLVYVKTTCGGVPEDGATVHVTRGGALNSVSIHAALIGTGTGMYSADVGNSLGVSDVPAFVQSVDNALTPICDNLGVASQGQQVLGLSAVACLSLVYPPLVAACEVSATGMQLVSDACSVKGGVDNTNSVINYLDSLSPNVDITVTGQLGAQGRQQNFPRQPALGPWSFTPVVLDDFDCTIDHITVAPANSTIAIGQAAPLTATAYDNSSQIMQSARFQWQWSSDTTSVATIPATGIAVPAGSPAIPSTPVVGMATGVSGGTANITATEQTNSKQGSAVVNVQACSATGSWNGTFSPTSGNSGTVTASFTQNETAVSGSVNVTDKKGTHSTNVTGSNNNGAVSFGPVNVDNTTDDAAGTFSSNCSTLSGSFVVSGTKTVVGSYSLNKQ